MPSTPQISPPESGILTAVEGGEREQIELLRSLLHEIDPDIEARGLDLCAWPQCGCDLDAICHVAIPAVELAEARARVADLLEALTELSDAVFGREMGDEPNVYADYDALLALARKTQTAIAKALTPSTPPVLTDGAVGSGQGREGYE